MKKWTSCKRILCITADNMGHLIMASPAIRALKESFRCSITVLTSSSAAGVAAYLPEIDDVIVYDLPWIKTNKPVQAGDFFDIIERIRSYRFDGAVIFTSFSQCPMAGAMLAYLAGIPLRLAYCREDPYHLLTDWIPDKEPYSFIRHQVTRDVELVEKIGATTKNHKLMLRIPDDAWWRAEQKLKQGGIHEKQPWMVLHAPVSETRRAFPLEIWATAARQMNKELSSCQLVLTGLASEKNYTDSLKQLTGDCAFSMAGVFALDEFIALIMHSPVLVSVNTGSIHIASAVNTPVVVLYARTNPQHTPWKVPQKVLYFDVPPALQSRNEVLRHVCDYVMEKPGQDPTAEDIVTAVKQLLGPKFYSAQAGKLHNKN